MASLANSPFAPLNVFKYSESLALLRVTKRDVIKSNESSVSCRVDGAIIRIFGISITWIKTMKNKIKFQN